MSRSKPYAVPVSPPKTRTKKCKTLNERPEQKALKKSSVDENKAEEKEIRRSVPPGYVPWSNPNELQATDRNSRQGPGTSGTRRVVTPTRHQDTSPGAEALKIQRKVTPGCVPWSNPNQVQVAERNTTQGPGISDSRRLATFARQQDASPGRAEALSRPGRHRPVFIEETRPGAVLVPGFDDDGLTVEEENDEQVTIASHEDESTINVIARAVDTEEENRMRHELYQLRQMQIRHERMLNNAPILTPVIAPKRDAENGDENVHAYHDGLPRSGDPKCGHKGRQWFAMSAILLIVIAIAVTLTVVLKSEPTPPGPNTQEPATIAPTAEPTPSQDLIDLLSSASSDGGVALADPSTPQKMALNWIAGDPNLESYTDQVKIQRYALATLYYATKGDSWIDNAYWLSYEPVCGKWYNRFYSDDMVVGCTNDGISFLALGDNNLQGPIPPEIGMLSNSLDFFWFDGNALEGDMPTEIGELTKLTIISLWGNNLTGTIPSELGLLTKLTWLNLSYNGFTGSVPTSLASLTLLKTLYLIGTSLTGSLDSLCSIGIEDFQADCGQDEIDCQCCTSCY